MDCGGNTADFLRFWHSRELMRIDSRVLRRTHSNARSFSASATWA
ncbi:MAG: hypothetical protein QOH91_965 [Mycobacterium sp.]|nr:hypothetical protein [Mycobacterium sp.]